MVDISCAVWGAWTAANRCAGSPCHPGRRSIATTLLLPEDTPHEINHQCYRKRLHRPFLQVADQVHECRHRLILSVCRVREPLQSVTGGEFTGPDPDFTWGPAFSRAPRQAWHCCVCVLLFWLHVAAHWWPYAASLGYAYGVSPTSWASHYPPLAESHSILLPRTWWLTKAELKILATMPDPNGQ
jgi:hypothetical protein